MPAEPVFRGLAIVVLLGLLVGSLVLGGADWPASPTEGPDLEEVIDDPDAYLDEPVYLSGEVIDAEEGILEVEHDNVALEVEIEGIPTEELEEGLEVTIGGELVDDAPLEVEVHRFATREPWEVQYMYTVSLLGAILAIAYALNTWRFNRRARVIEPRERTLLARLRTGGASDG